MVPPPLEPNLDPASLPSSARITARSGSNLALAFFCLDKERRAAMATFYAFCRVVDDVADSETLPLDEKQRQLEFWREELRRCYVSTPLSPLGKELAAIIRTYLIPPTPLEEIVAGVEMDLSKRRYATFAELEQYCYRVASAVGLVSIEIFSYRHAITRDYAIALGMAFQLTNILRDVLKDASNDRIYLPQEEMARFGVTDEDILQGKNTPAVRQLLLAHYHRARHYFAKAWRLIHPEDRPHLLAAEIMREIYAQLLEAIHADGLRLRNPPLRFNKVQKAFLIGRALWREHHRRWVPPPPKHVLILGGGLAGLRAATALVESGHRVTVVEAKPHLGGRAYSFHHPQSGETLDNGQHILMGCYPASLRWLEALGARHKLLELPRLALAFVGNRGSSLLQAASLPAPFHLLAGLWGYEELGWQDRWSALRLGLALRLGHQPHEDETAAQWLQRLKQSRGITRALWEPLCLAALNESLNNASARLLATVLRRALLASPAGSRILLSKVGLSELFSTEVRDWLELSGSHLLTSHQVKALHWDEAKSRITAVETHQGQCLTADHVLLALPWNALRPLLPSGSPLHEQTVALEDSAIVSLAFWVDRSLELQGPILGLLDSPVHWLFDRQQIDGRDAQGDRGFLYIAVISAANDLAERTTESLTTLIWSEVQRLVPAAREARLLNTFLYKAKSATFSATPAAERHRPGTATQWSNVWVAGDWTRTDLPATIEGAVLSGELAARAIDASTTKQPAASSVAHSSTASVNASKVT